MAGPGLSQAERRQRKLAGTLVKAAIRSGLLPPLQDRLCRDCGRAAAHYHHPNGYGPGHELEVVPLCRSCHARKHHVGFAWTAARIAKRTATARKMKKIRAERHWWQPSQS